MKIPALLLMMFEGAHRQQTVIGNRQNRGRPRITEATNVFKSIFYKIKTGCSWEHVKLFGNFSSSTVFKYFRSWSTNGLLESVFITSLKRYSSRKRIRWSHQAIDSTSIKAWRGGENIGPNSTDRGRNGSKIHTLVDALGIPLTFFVTQANYHDSRAVEQLINTYKIRRPNYEQIMNLDTAYDTNRIRTLLVEKNFRAIIPHNRRNAHVAPPPMNEADREDYRSRIRVENQFAQLKQYKSISNRYCRSLLSFTNCINIAYASMVCKRTE